MVCGWKNIFQLHSLDVGEYPTEKVGRLTEDGIIICPMKTKVIKYNSDLFKQEITLTVDENFNKLKG